MRFIRKRCIIFLDSAAAGPGKAKRGPAELVPPSAKAAGGGRGPSGEGNKRDRGRLCTTYRAQKQQL